VEDLRAFARLLTALRPWLGQLVIVGGWAHRLHRLHRLAESPSHPPLRTRDTDLAFGADEVFVGNVQKALAEAGFTEQLFGDDAPPATHYGLGDEDGGFYAEFLTPLTGGELKRGKRDATVSRAGITAQKLRYLDVLLVEPWMLHVAPDGQVPIGGGFEVFVPNPVTFIAQRLLIHSERSPAKKAQDVLYIHDTLELFGGALPELRHLWVEGIRPTIVRAWARKIETVAGAMFTEVSDTIREAARIAQARRLAPQDVRQACAYGLGEVLGLPDGKSG
jgi:hypothetical protein